MALLGLDPVGLDESATTATSRGVGLRRNAGLLYCLLTVLGISVLIDAPAFFGGHPANSLILSGGDVAEQVWFLGWLPHAMLHGLNPFLSHQLFAGSGGVNLMVNTSIFAPALVLSPVTLLGGPVLAFNVGVVLTPVLSAWPMYVLSRRFTPSATLASVAAVLWAFSPYVLSFLALGHFHQTVSFFPPLALLLIVDLASGRRSPRRSGVLGACGIVAQYFTGSELLAMTALELGLGLVVLAILRPQVLVSNWRRAATGLAWAAGCSFVMLAYPLWMEFFGPRHTTGKPWGDTFAYGNWLSGFVSAPLGLGHGDRMQSLFGAPGFAGSLQSFLGWGMVLTVLCFTIWMRRDRRVVALFFVGFLTFVLSLGPAVQTWADAQPSGIWMPWRLLRGLPVLEQLIPNRLSQMIGFACVLICLLGWEQVRSVLSGRSRLARSAVLASSMVFVALPQVVSATVLFPSTTSFYEPAWAARYGANPEPHAHLLVFPYVDSGFGNESSPMTWQARSNFSYALVGGYVLVPTTNSSASAWRVPPTGSEGALQEFMNTYNVAKLNAAQREAIARAMAERSVTTVALLSVQSDNNLAAAELTAIMGSAPRDRGDVLVWRHVHAPRPLDISSALIEQCAQVTQGQSPVAAANCVIFHAKS